MCLLKPVYSAAELLELNKSLMQMFFVVQEAENEQPLKFYIGGLNLWRIFVQNL